MIENSKMPLVNRIIYCKNAYQSIKFSATYILKVLFTEKPQWLEHGWLVYHAWTQLDFESLVNSTDSSRKQIFRGIVLLYDEMCAVCTH